MGSSAGPMQLCTQLLASSPTMDLHLPGIFKEIEDRVHRSWKRVSDLTADLLLWAGGRAGWGEVEPVPCSASLLLYQEKKLIGGAGQGCDRVCNVGLQLFSASSTAEMLGRSKGLECPGTWAGATDLRLKNVSFVAGLPLSCFLCSQLLLKKKKILHDVSGFFYLHSREQISDNLKYAFIRFGSILHVTCHWSLTFQTNTWL